MHDKQGRGKMILLLPGASATGRDFLLEKLLGNLDILGSRIGLGRPLCMEVARKTTTRPSRQVELLKKCVTHEEFLCGLDSGEIIAPYILESNGHRYGYERDVFKNNSADILVADASVYQVPHLKKEFGEDIYAAAMIATRDYREKNLKARGSENPEEMEQRLNLGDAHVAIAILMTGRKDIDYREYIHPDLANWVSSLIENERDASKRELVADIENAIEKFTRSQNIVSAIRNLVKSQPCMDDLIILTDDHRIDPELPIVKTKFFDLGVSLVADALKRKNKSNVSRVPFSRQIFSKFGYPDTLIKQYDNWSLMLRPNQTTLGSLVLVCNEDVKDLSAVSDVAMTEFTYVVRDIEKRMKVLFGYNKMNYLMLMMVDPEVHYHIIPRYSSSRIFDEFEFQDFSWPNPPALSRINEITSDTKERLVEYIREGFE